MNRVSRAVLLTANLLFFWPVIFHGRVYSSHDVALAQYPWRAGSGVRIPANRLLADPASSGEAMLRDLAKEPGLWLWNPYLAGGVPGAINLVQGYLSPFAWLPALLLREAWIETGILFLKFNAGFLFAFLLLRRRRFSDLAASAGAAVWAWSSAQGVWWLWMHSSVSVCFPLLLLAADLAFDSPRTDRAVAIGALAFLLFLSGGYPFWILYGGGLLLLDLLLRCRDPRFGRAAGRLAASALLSVAILSPAALLSWRLVRATGQAATRAGVAGQYSLPLRQLRLYFAPDYAGDTWSDDYRGVGLYGSDNYVEGAAAAGPLALGLALLGLASRRKRLAAFCLLAGAAVFVPLYLGGPLRRVIGETPLLSAGPLERAKIVIVFAISLSAAAGTELLENLLRGGLAARLLRVAPFAVAVPLVFLDAKFYPAVPPARAVFRDTPGIAALRRAGAGAPARVTAVGWTLFPDLPMAVDLEDVRGHLWHEAWYRRLLAAADPQVYGRTGTLLVFHPSSFRADAPVLDLLGVAAVASAPDAACPNDPAAATDFANPYALRTRRAPPEAPCPALYRGGDLTVFGRPSAFPRFFAVGTVAPGGVSEVARASRAVLRTTAFVPPRDAARLAGNLGGNAAGTRVEILSYSPGAIRLRVSAPAPVFLASSEKLFPPYWRVRLDGAPVAPVPTDGLFLGLAIPAGSHRLDARFKIPGGELLVSVAALLALTATGAFALRRR